MSEQNKKTIEGMYEAFGRGDIPFVIGALDPDAIARVREEARPDPRDADELHDTLMTVGFLPRGEIQDIEPQFVSELSAARRAGISAYGALIAAERLPELRAIHPDLVVEPSLQPPASRLAKTWTRSDAIAELLRGRLTIRRGLLVL